MELLKNLAKAHRVAWRKAVELDKKQPIVAIAGWYAVPSADELEYECAGGEIIAVYCPAGECEANINWC